MTPQFLALVVETNYLIASAIEFPLSQGGYGVVIATTHDEALAALTSHRIDVAIIDFRLQHGADDGLVSRLSAAGVPFIFCTASTAQEVVEHFPGARARKALPRRDARFRGVRGGRDIAKGPTLRDATPSEANPVDRVAPRA